VLMARDDRAAFSCAVADARCDCQSYRHAAGAPSPVQLSRRSRHVNVTRTIIFLCRSSWRSGERWLHEHRCTAETAAWKLYVVYRPPVFVFPTPWQNVQTLQGSQCDIHDSLTEVFFNLGLLLSCVSLSV